jgi:hypothetical protein
VRSCDFEFDCEESLGNPFGLCKQGVSGTKKYPLIISIERGSNKPKVVGSIPTPSTVVYQKIPGSNPGRD